MICRVPGPENPITTVRFSIPEISHFESLWNFFTRDAPPPHPDHLLRLRYLLGRSASCAKALLWVTTVIMRAAFDGPDGAGTVDGMY